jgi:hypothetical protein
LKSNHDHSYAEGYRERGERAMLDLAGDTPHGVVAELRCSAGKISELFPGGACENAHGIGAPEKSAGHGAQRRSNGVADMIRGLGGSRRHAASQTLLDRAQALLDLRGLGGFRARMTRETKHSYSPDRSRVAICAVGPSNDRGARAGFRRAMLLAGQRSSCCRDW